MQIMTIRAWRLETHKPQSLDWGSWPKHDVKELGLEVGDELIKVISDDKQTVTFKKKEKVSLSVSKLIDQGIKENWELLEWLKDK